MRRIRKVKILATLGPASSEETQIAALFEAGADVFRINMSHTKHDDMRELVARIRRVEEAVGRPIGILADLQGPKLRVGAFADEALEDGVVPLARGDRFTFDDDPAPGTRERVHLPHPEILETAEIGHRLLIDDGRLALRVVEKGKGRLTAEVEAGTKISARKGVALPDTLLPSGALTQKDRADLDAVLDADVDWIALSFVQRPEDLSEVRKVARGRAALMAKIEKPQALERLDEIIEMSDALMVARGDLGVETPLESVPGLQKQMTRACRRAGKPVVVATQMLESMVEAVRTMVKIARSVERDANYASIIYAQRPQAESTGADAIALAARQIAETLNLGAIVCYTASGTTGFRVARERPPTPIIALSPVLSTARRLAIVWGLHCVVTPDAQDLDDMVDRACRIAHDEDFGRPGDRVIVTAGVPLRTPGATNMLRIAYIGSDGRSGI